MSITFHGRGSLAGCAILLELAIVGCVIFVALLSHCARINRSSSKIGRTLIQLGFFFAGKYQRYPFSSHLHPTCTSSTGAWTTCAVHNTLDEYMHATTESQKKRDYERQQPIFPTAVISRRHCISHLPVNISDECLQAVSDPLSRKSATRYTAHGCVGVPWLSGRQAVRAPCCTLAAGSRDLSGNAS